MKAITSLYGIKVGSLLKPTSFASCADYLDLVVVTKSDIPRSFNVIGINEKIGIVEIPYNFIGDNNLKISQLTLIDEDEEIKQSCAELIVKLEQHQKERLSKDCGEKYWEINNHIEKLIYFLGQGSSGIRQIPSWFFSKRKQELNSLILN